MSAITERTLNIPMYTLTVPASANKPGAIKNYMPSMALKDPLSSYLERVKGASDTLGVVGKGAKLLSMTSPETMGYASHVAQVANTTRGGLSLINFYGCLTRFIDSATKKDVDWVDVTKNSMDLSACGTGAASMLVTDKLAASVLSGTAGTFKTVADCFALGTTVDKLMVLGDLQSRTTVLTGGVAVAAEGDVPKVEITPEVKTGLDSEFTVTYLKVGALALGLITGILSALAFVFKITIAKELLVAGAVAALGSALFSVASELTGASAEFVPVPKEYFKVTHPMYEYLEPKTI